MDNNEKIPAISDQRLEELCRRIKPVARFLQSRGKGKVVYHPDERGDLYYIRNVDPRGEAFTWDPKPTQRAKGLVLLQEIVTCHDYNMPVLFKPSIAEVLAQIPACCIDQVVAFETSANAVVLIGPYHRTTTRLYVSDTQRACPGRGP